MSEEYQVPQIGDRVVRGPHWIWGDQDRRSADGTPISLPEGKLAIGTVTGQVSTPHWYRVTWDSGHSNEYPATPSDQGIRLCPITPETTPVASPTAYLDWFRHEDTWESRFLWLEKNTVLRPAQTLARLRIPFVPEWDGLPRDRLQAKVADALSKAFPGAPTKDSARAGILARSNDKAWSQGRFGATTVRRSMTAPPAADVITVPVACSEDCYETVRNLFERRFRFDLDLDKDRVLDFIRDDDEDGLREYIEECISEEYVNHDGDDQSPYDTEYQDDSGSLEHELEYPEGNRHPASIAARLMEEFADEAAEEEEEDDDN